MVYKGFLGGFGRDEVIISIIRGINIRIEDRRDFELFCLVFYVVFICFFILCYRGYFVLYYNIIFRIYYKLELVVCRLFNKSFGFSYSFRCN